MFNSASLCTAYTVKGSISICIVSERLVVLLLGGDAVVDGS